MPFKSIKQQLDNARKRLQTSLGGRVKAGQQNAAEAAVETMEPRCRPKGKGGMHHGTFQATVRRHGEWKEDWNEILSDPMNRAIAVEWSQSMQRDLPGCIESAMLGIRSELQRLQKELKLPEQPFHEAAAKLVEEGRSVKVALQQKQTELSRQIKESVKAQMLPAYNSAEAQTGQGMDERQKAKVRDHVIGRGSAVFAQAGNLLTDELDALLAMLGQLLHDSGAKAVDVLEKGMALLSAEDHELLALRRLRQSYSSSVAELLTRRPERQVLWRELRDLAEEKEARGRGELPAHTGEAEDGRICDTNDQQAIEDNDSDKAMSCDSDADSDAESERDSEHPSKRRRLTRSLSEELESQLTRD